MKGKVAARGAKGSEESKKWRGGEAKVICNSTDSIDKLYMKRKFRKQFDNFISNDLSNNPVEKKSDD